MLVTGADPVQRQDLQDYFCKDTNKPFFELREGLLRPARAQCAADSFSAVKPAGQARVFVVGESVAQILGSGRLQEKASPGLEIINCGMGGYESRRISAVLDETLGYDPDLVVLLSGNNEGGKEPCPGISGDLRRREQRLWERLYSVLGGGYGKIEASLKIHERRVRSMAAAARKKGVPLVVCTLPYNYLLPPHGSAPLENPAFYRGRRALEKKDYAAAVSEFTNWLKKEPENPFAAYYAGIALFAAGKTADSLEYLELAPKISSSQDKTSAARNAMLRRVAQEEGACLADLEAAFRKLSPGGVPGFEQFTDGVHWRSGYGGAAWDAIFSAARACGIKGAAGYKGAAAGPQENADWDAPEKRLSYAVSWMSGDELSEKAVVLLEYLAGKSPKVLEKALSSPAALRQVFISNFWSSGTAAGLEAVYPGFVFHAAEAYRRSGRLKAALELAEKLSKSGYANWRLNLLKARTLSALGRDKEAAALLRGLAGGRHQGEAAFALGLALGLDVPAPCSETPREKMEKSRDLSDRGAKLMAGGDAAGAAKAFSAAYETDPFNTGALMSLCVAEKRLGQIKAALEHCAEAAAAALKDCGRGGGQSRVQAAGALLETGRIHQEAGRPAEAAAALKKALKTAPAKWDRAAEAGELLNALKR